MPSASCGRSWWYVSWKQSNACCCARIDDRGGDAVSAFHVAWKRSCRPFLVGSSGLDAHRRHAKPHEPDAESRQPAKAAGAERRPAVAQHVLRQPEGAERFFESPPDVVGLRLHHRLAHQRRPAVHVVDGQRVAARAVADAKPALGCHRPDVALGQRFDARRRRRLPTKSLAARLHEAGAMQDRVDRAARRQVVFRPLAVELPVDLLRAPRRMRLAHPQDRRLLLRRRLVGVRLRRPRGVAEPRQAQLRVALPHP
jgi:hypothetical protein